MEATSPRSPSAAGEAGEAGDEACSPSSTAAVGEAGEACDEACSPSSTAVVAAASERDDYDCPVCHELLYQPCVPCCGHAFCKACLQQLLQHAYSKRLDGTGGPESGPKCPVCRRVLHVTRASDLAVCGRFDRLLASSFPAEYAARAQAVSLEGDGAGDIGGQALPLFVLDSLLPGQHLQLNVFEPRYVRMVRGAIEGGQCFGMIGGARTGMAAYGVEVKIVGAAEQWDGRFLLEIVGTRVFKVVHSSVASDGLVEAMVDFIRLEEGGGGEDDARAAEDAAADLLPLVEQWETAVHVGNWERWPGQLARVKEQLGPTPPSSQPGTLAAWIVALINPLPALGVAPETRPALLAATSPLGRVQVAREGLEASLNYLQTAEKSWVVRALRYVPKPLQPRVPALAVLAVAIAISWAWPLW